MRKPEDYKGNHNEFSEYMWMAEEDPEKVEQEVEEEMVLIEQEFLEAMFEQLLKEEEDKETYYGPPDTQPSNQTTVDQQASNGTTYTMELPVIMSNLNPNAPEFVPRFTTSAGSS